MRAGAFAETRVIDLVNRRFVPFFYNVSADEPGASEPATAFVGTKTDNPHAFLAAFTPEGEYLGETAVYADKHGGVHTGSSTCSRSMRSTRSRAQKSA